MDASFWAFHGVAAPALGERDALAEPGARGGARAPTEGADAAGARRGGAGDPGSTLFGRRDDPGRALRLRVSGVQPAAALGEFSLRPRQHEVRALFVPLATLQAAFGQPGRVNLVLGRGDGAAAIAADLARSATLEDLGLRLREVEPGRSWSLESDDALVADAVVAAARDAAAALGPRRLRVADLPRERDARRASRALPYSLVAAVDAPPWQAIACGGASVRRRRPEPPARRRSC